MTLRLISYVTGSSAYCIFKTGLMIQNTQKIRTPISWPECLISRRQYTVFSVVPPVYCVHRVQISQSSHRFPEAVPHYIHSLAEGHLDLQNILHMRRGIENPSSRGSKINTTFIIYSLSKLAFYAVYLTNDLCKKLLTNLTLEKN